jgi:hypothetical protein
MTMPKDVPSASQDSTQLPDVWSDPAFLALTAQDHAAVQMSRTLKRHRRAAREILMAHAGLALGVAAAGAFTALPWGDAVGIGIMNLLIGVSTMALVRQGGRRVTACLGPDGPNVGAWRTFLKNAMVDIHRAARLISVVGALGAVAAVASSASGDLVGASVLVALVVGSSLLARWAVKRDGRHLEEAVLALEGALPQPAR